MILPEVRDPRLVTIRRGGTLTDADHHLLALWAAAYAIKAAMAAGTSGKEEEEAARQAECRWQPDRLPDAVRELVLEDQRRRNDICWNVFDV